MRSKGFGMLSFIVYSLISWDFEQYAPTLEDHCIARQVDERRASRDLAVDIILRAAQGVDVSAFLLDPPGRVTIRRLDMGIDDDHCRAAIDNESVHWIPGFVGLVGRGKSASALTFPRRVRGKENENTPARQTTLKPSQPARKNKPNFARIDLPPFFQKLHDTRSERS